MTTRQHAAFGLFVAASAILLWRTIGSLVSYSWDHESCSHILLIPFVVLWLVYTDRARIFVAPRFSPALGVPVIVAGIALWAAEGTQSLSLAGLSLVLLWIGGFLLCYGSQAARASAFPLLFLLLMVPLPDSVLNRTIYLLQEGSTEISYLLFKAVGVPVLRQGFLLSVPGVTIEVAQECSGIRSSMALFITCLLAAHLFLRTSWKMLIFIALVFPLAIIKNGIRITTLTLLSIYVDPGFLTGRLHREGGFVFFLLALAILAPVLLVLQKWEMQDDRLRARPVTEG